MVCSNCGKELTEPGKFCPHCGNTVENPVEPSGAEIGKPKRKLNRILLVIPAVLVLIALAAWAAVNYGLFLSPKQYYMLMESKNFSHTSKTLKEEYAVYYDKYVKPTLEKPYSYNMELSLDDNIQGVPMDEQTLSMIKGAKLAVKSSLDPKKKQSVQDIGITLNGTELIKALLTRDGDKVGLSVPALLNKVFTADLSNMEPVYNNLGIMDTSTLPRKIMLDNDELLKALKFDQKDLDALSDKYSKLYYESLPDSSVALERGSSLELGGTAARYNKITVKLDREGLNTLLKTFVSAMKDDEKLYDLSLGNIKRVLEYYKEMGYTQYENIDMESLNQDAYKKFFQDMLDGLESSTDVLPDGFTMTLWVDGSGILVKRVMETLIKSDDTTVVLNVMVENFKDKEGKSFCNWDILMSDKASGGNSEAHFALGIQSYEDKSDKSKRDLLDAALTFEGEEVGADLSNTQFRVKLDSRATGQPADSSRTWNTKYEVAIQIPNDPSGSLKLSGDVGVTETENAKDKTLKDEYTVGIKAETGDGSGESVAGTLRLKTEMAYDIQFSLPAVEPGNEVNLNTATPEELGAAMEELGMAAQQFIMNNPTLMGN